jgi:trk system potassium uptake protein TrkH
MHAKGVTWTLAMLSALFGTGMIATSLVAVYYQTGHGYQFVISGAGVSLLGLIVMRLTGPAPTQLSHRDGFLIVALAWVVLSTFGAVPFWITGTCHSIADGLFESVSGMTTTGATVLTGLDNMPPSILFWRSMQQWLGGMGIIVLAVAVMPLLGTGGMQLLKAEVPGPVKDKLTARVTETARALWYVYLGITAICTLAYWWAGMGLFDAVNHAMTTVSTGGFSTHDASFGYYSLPRLHLIAALFMFLSGMNFALHFAALRGGGSLRLYFADEEFRTYTLWVVALVLLTGWLATSAGSDHWDMAIFDTISVISTTGFTVSDYSLWPPGATLLLLMAMFVGACAGSTAGGLKVIRILLLFRQGMRELRRLVHPHAILPVLLGKQRVAPSVTEALWGFAVLFMVCYFFIAMLVALTGVDMMTAISASAACITSTGPGFGGVGPAHTYAFLPDLAKVALTFGMILGRLEIYTIFLLLVPEFWRR